MKHKQMVPYRHCGVKWAIYKSFPGLYSWHTFIFKYTSSSKSKQNHIPLKIVGWKKNGKSSQCPKKISERPSESLESYCLSPLKNKMTTQVYIHICWLTFNVIFHFCSLTTKTRTTRFRDISYFMRFKDWVANADRLLGVFGWRLRPSYIKYTDLCVDEERSMTYLSV